MYAGLKLALGVCKALKAAYFESIAYVACAPGVHVQACMWVKPFFQKQPNATITLPA